MSAVDTPELATASSPQVRRAQQSLGIVELLGAATLVLAGGVRIPGPHAEPLFDIEALMTTLRDRCLSDCPTNCQTCKTCDRGTAR